MHGCDVFVDDGDLILSLTWEISSTSGEECGERTGEVALIGELINGHSPSRWPHQGSRQR